MSDFTDLHIKPLLALAARQTATVQAAHFIVECYLTNEGKPDGGMSMFLSAHQTKEQADAACQQYAKACKTPMLTFRWRQQGKFVEFVSSQVEPLVEDAAVQEQLRQHQERFTAAEVKYKAQQELQAKQLAEETKPGTKAYLTQVLIRCYDNYTAVTRQEKQFKLSLNACQTRCSELKVILTANPNAVKEAEAYIRTIAGNTADTVLTWFEHHRGTLFPVVSSPALPVPPST